MRPKIAFMVHMLAPYRVSFYSKLFAVREYEWKLFAGYKTNKVDARPQFEGDVDFDVSFHQEKITNRFVYNEVNNITMAESVMEFNPDIVIMFAHVGTASFRKVLNWAKKKNKKVIMWTCFWEPEYITGYKRFLRNLIINSFYKKADHHIAYSSLARQQLLDIGYPESRISIAYNGIETDLYDVDQTAPLPQSQAFDRDAVSFLYVGGFGKDKKVDLFIKAIGECSKFGRRKVKAYLIGDGPMIGECKSLVNVLDLNGSVKFLGRITDKLSSYIKAADCIVLPGTGGLILNEAILFEKPVVVSKADGTEHDLLLNGYNGIKFQPNSKSSLAAALSEIAENLPFFQQNAANFSGVVVRRSNVDAMVHTFVRAVKNVDKESGRTFWRTAVLPENNGKHYDQESSTLSLPGMLEKANIGI